MKLFYAPGACSMAVHIALNEVGRDYDLEKVDLAAKTTESGDNYLDINSKGYVPCMQLDNGEYLTEVQALLQYIADNNPDANLLPGLDDTARYRVLESMNYISTELHKNFGPMFNPASSDEQRQAAQDLVTMRLGLIDELLASGQHIAGEQFSIADAYLTTVLGWTQFVKMDLSPWPNIAAYVGRVMARPAIQKTLKEEGMA
jgi:glutathione S-transferase